MPEPTIVDLALDATTNDLVFESRDLTTVTGIDLVRQRLNVILKLFKGEWFLDADAGIPYFQEILKKGVDLTNVDAILRAEIIGTEDVNRFISYTPVALDAATRTISVAFTVDTVYGPVTVEGALI